MRKIITTISTLLSMALFFSAMAQQTPTDTIKVSLQHTENYGLVLDTIGFFPRSVAGDGTIVITSMYIDENENIYVLGYMFQRFSPEFKPFFTSYQLTPIQLHPRKGGNVPNTFIAKYDKNFNLIWQKGINSNANMIPYVMPNSKLLIDKQNNTAYFYFQYNDDGERMEGRPSSPIYCDDAKIMEFRDQDWPLTYSPTVGDSVENRKTNILLKFNLEDGSIAGIERCPFVRAEFNIDDNGNIYTLTNINSETNVNFYYPGEQERNFSVPENIGKPREEWINNYIIVKYYKDMRYLSGFQIKNTNIIIDEIKIDAEENIYIAGRGRTSPITLADPETDETISLYLRGTTRGFVVKYAHKGNNTYSIDWAKSKYSVGYNKGSIAFNEENLLATPGLVGADGESIYLLDENMRPQSRLFQHKLGTDMKFLNNELFVKKANEYTTGRAVSLPVEGDTCIPAGMDYISCKDIPGYYTQDFFLFSLDEHNMLKWKLSHSSPYYNLYPTAIHSKIIAHDFHITGNKRIYITGEVAGMADLDPAEPSRGTYIETTKRGVVGGGTSFLARYVETYRVKAATEIQNGAILFDTSMVRNGGSCTISLVSNTGYSLEAGSLSTTNGSITPNADGTYTLSDVTKPAVITANFVLPTGVEEIPAGNTLKIYPNPAKDELRIESGDLRVENVEILDVSGKKLSKSDIHISANSVNVSTLPKGMYFIQIKTDKGVVTEKFTKE